MKIAVFSTMSHDRESLDRANESAGHEITYFDTRLKAPTAPLAKGFSVVSAFVNDTLDEEVLHILADGGTKLIALRSSGFNNVDLRAAEKLNITVTRVPSYSPHSVAEHTIGLMLALNRRIHRAYNRVREANFSIDGLLGFDFHGKTAGVMGTGRIGEIVANILAAFGCRILAHDIKENPACRDRGARYVSLPELIETSDIISLHCPLTPDTRHIIDSDSIRAMKPGVMLINTSRGGLIDTTAVTDGLKSGKIGHLGLDVYEEEGDLFFADLSETVVQDDVFMRLLTFPNVLITGHQGFYTKEAVREIAETTIRNISSFEKGTAENQARYSELVAA